MNKDKMIRALNESLAMELSAITQYMWQHVMARGIESPAFRDKVREISLDEMRHAERFAERIAWFGGVPTTELTHIHVGGKLEKMIEDDIKIEKEAIEAYKRHLEAVQDDLATYQLLIETISEEEEHLDYFLSLAETRGS